MIIVGSSVLKSISQTCNPFETSSGLSGGKGRTHTVGLQSNFVRILLPKMVSLLSSRVTKPTKFCIYYIGVFDPWDFLSKLIVCFVEEILCLPIWICEVQVLGFWIPCLLLTTQ